LIVSPLPLSANDIHKYKVNMLRLYNLNLVPIRIYYSLGFEKNVLQWHLVLYKH